MSPKTKEPLFKNYNVVLQFRGKFASALPTTYKENLAMLLARENKRAKVDGMPSFEAVAAGIAASVAQRAITDERGHSVVTLTDSEATSLREAAQDKEPEAPIPHATFHRNELGQLMYELRCIRGHYKDCALQVGQYIKQDADEGDKTANAFKAAVANGVFIQDAEGNDTNLFVLVHEDGVTPYLKPDGLAGIDSTELFNIHVPTPRGLRSSQKLIDFIERPRMSFTLRVFSGSGKVTQERLEMLFTYGGEHGMGQERSGGVWGKYNLVSLTLKE